MATRADKKYKAHQLNEQTEYDENGAGTLRGKNCDGSDDDDPSCQQEARTEHFPRVNFQLQAHTYDDSRDARSAEDKLPAQTGSVKMPDRVYANETDRNDK